MNARKSPSCASTHEKEGRAWRRYPSFVDHFIVLTSGNLHSNHESVGADRSTRTRRVALRSTLLVLRLKSPLAANPPDSGANEANNLGMESVPTVRCLPPSGSQA